MIKAENLSKKYKLYSSGFSRLKDWLTPRSMKFHTEFWALSDVSFELKAGESLGIIGVNGSGKSSLLKILSGALRPTSGSCHIDGRATSFLDLGLGFHPQLSGRENITLSAKFLGLNREEIKARLKEMIEFAELGSFIDYPIKTYSSGMFVRLGFAVAAGADPDVLIIDEALSVGDGYFQKKSMNRIDDFRKSGKAVVIVSHVMLFIRSLCDKTLWLNEGEVEAFGKPDEVVNEYELFLKRRERVMFEGKDNVVQPIGVAAAKEDSGEYSKMLENRWETGKIKIVKVELAGEDGKSKWHFTPGEKVRIRLYYDASTPIDNPVFILMVYGSDGAVLFVTANYNIDPFDFGELRGTGCVEYTLDQLNLNKGTYVLSVGVYLEPDQILLNNPADFHYKKYDFEVWSDKVDQGVIHMKGTWRVSEHG